jgi:hypothetical protein
MVFREWSENEQNAAESLIKMKNSDPDFLFDYERVKEHASVRWEMFNILKVVLIKNGLTRPSNCAAKLEYMLFKRASTIREYIDMSTINQRIHEIIEEELV